MTEFTRTQKTFMARAAIVSVLGEYMTDDGDLLGEIDIEYPGVTGGVPDAELVDLGINQDILDGYRLATDDQMKIRKVVEENAAFKHLMEKMTLAYPKMSRAELQQMVRGLVEEADVREAAVRESGVYAKMGFNL